MLSRLSQLAVTAALLCYCSLLSAQPAAVAGIGPGQQAYYLLQAFQARTAQARPALWHIGVEVAPLDSDYVVTAMLDGYPAELAGLRRGDRLLQVDGQPFHPVYSFNPRDGETGQTTHELELERDGEHLTTTVTAVRENLYDSRRSAFLQSIQQFSAGNKTIAYMHLWSLSRNLNDLRSFFKVLDELALSDGLILDLRNSYGYLSIQHLDSFFPSRRDLFHYDGPALAHTDLDTRETPLRSRPYGKPVAVLINAGTAGGALLLAHELAKMDRVTTIGTEVTTSLVEPVLAATAETPDLITLPTAGGLIDGQPATEFRLVPKLAIDYPLTGATRSDPQFEAAFNVLMGRI